MADRRGTAPENGAPDGSGHGEMVSKKSRGSKPPTRSQIKKDLRKLKSVGLYSGDLRKKPTRYAIGQTKKFKDVLQKKARVLNAPSRSQAREHKEIFKVKGRKIVVPVRKGERVFYSKKTGEVFSYRKQYGRNVKRTFPKRMRTVRDIDKLPQGPNITYGLPIGIGGAIERMTYAEVKAFAQKYSKSTAWKAYLEIYEDEDYEDNDNERNDDYGDNDE